MRTESENFSLIGLKANLCSRRLRLCKCLYVAWGLFLFHFCCLFQCLTLLDGCLALTFLCVLFAELLLLFFTSSNIRILDWLTWACRVTWGSSALGLIYFYFGTLDLYEASGSKSASLETVVWLCRFLFGSYSEKRGFTDCVKIGLLFLTFLSSFLSVHFTGLWIRPFGRDPGLRETIDKFSPLDNRLFNLTSNNLLLFLKDVRGSSIRIRDSPCKD